MKVLKQDAAGICLMDLLLDETICSGTIKILPELVRKAGGINRKLHEKKKYELILRIAQTGPLLFAEQGEENTADGYIILQDDEAQGTDSWRTDSYIIGKYRKQLQQNDCFDEAVQCVLAQADKMGQMQQAIPFLEEMVAHGERFCQIEEGEKPVLLYQESRVCHNILTMMQKQFGKALEEKCIPVIYFDFSKEGLMGIIPYLYKHFRAVVGMQSVLFDIKCEDQVHYLHEYIYGPKFNFIFDHPILLKKYMNNSLPNYCLLIHDQNYVDFVNDYFCEDAVLFPPAGMMPENGKIYERIYDVTFIGEYLDYRENLRLIWSMPRNKRFLANHFLLYMKKHPDATAENALRHVLKERKIAVTNAQFLELFHEMHVSFLCIKNYYREKVMHTILKAGIQLDVFGNSWERYAYKKQFANLILHPDVTVKEGVNIWRMSKLSLNVMSWHKAGFTERMAGIMLAGAVLVTDHTACLKEMYSGQDMLMFHLNQLDDLPNRINQLLQDEGKRKNMAQNGRNITLQKHTWGKRAEQFLELLENRSI